MDEIVPWALPGLGCRVFVHHRLGRMDASGNKVDLDNGTIKVEASLEQTKAGLRFKAPKTANGRRVRISAPLPLMPCARTGGAN